MRRSEEDNGDKRQPHLYHVVPNTPRRPRRLQRNIIPRQPHNPLQPTPLPRHRNIIRHQIPHLHAPPVAVPRRNNDPLAHDIERRQHGRALCGRDVVEVVRRHVVEGRALEGDEGEAECAEGGEGPAGHGLVYMGGWSVGGGGGARARGVSCWVGGKVR